MKILSSFVAALGLAGCTCPPIANDGMTYKKDSNYGIVEAGLRTQGSALSGQRLRTPDGVIDVVKVYPNPTVNIITGAYADAVAQAGENICADFYDLGEKLARQQDEPRKVCILRRLTQ